MPTPSEVTQAGLEVTKWLESYLSARPQISLHKKIIALAVFRDPGLNDLCLEALLNTALIACARTLTKHQSLPGFLLELKDLMATDFQSISLEALELTKHRNSP